MSPRQQRYRWRGWRGLRDADPEKKKRGIRNDQAAELARLERAAGVPYSGRGMTEQQATQRIGELRK